MARARRDAGIVAVPASDWRGIDPVHGEMAAVRAMTVAQRIEQWELLNSALAEMEEASFERRFPDLSPRHRFLVRMRMRYGVALATEVWPDLVEVENVDEA